MITQIKASAHQNGAGYGAKLKVKEVSWKKLTKFCDNLISTLFDWCRIYSHGNREQESYVVEP